MPVSSTSRPARNRALRAPYVALAGVLLLVVLAAVGATQGRAEPTGNYRPELAADTLEVGCYPLPEGVVLDFPYVVRRDGDAAAASGARRHLVLHWSLLETDEVRERLAATLADAGFDVEAGSTGDDVLSARRAETGGAATVVEARLTELDNPSPDPIVRGVLELDLPVAERASDAPDCDNPFVTKRFEEEQ
ncbi:hypothetical protein [Nocardioides sp. zg-DK7169]|uniref:hypothetical protein n=1 Tax=Nocardioides sp. zg-DK7169 TaxID=2736600 RepID=UPI00155812A6|nr:hypothetical protein [Nocardioides sp. zg-DK7169]NPC96803.1 hypothetical protein [Nocardioides sp. zg-DK7169]